MGVYIPNMEMPKKHGAYSMEIRLFVKEDGTASIWGLKKYIPNEPLDVIPVPPHGRLIDADAELKKLNRICLPDDLSYTIGHDIANQFLKDAPTIIPASEEGE